MSGILKITDGTRQVTLLANLAGIFTNSWVPQSSQSKNGGVWAESPFTDGRQLVLRNRGNIIDTFDIILKGGDQDISIANAKVLIALLEDALNYWLDDWQTGSHVKPVWIEYRGDCETETSYAYIYDYSWPSLSNPHDNPFRGGVADELSIIIEHGEWMSNPPGGSNEIPIYATDGATMGGEAVGTSSAQATTDLINHFATMKYINGNLSFVYKWDQSTATYTDITNPAVTATLFNVPVQVNDAVYYGAVDFPFDSVVHDLTNKGDGTVTLALEYWNGAWVAVSAFSSIPELEPEYFFTGAARVSAMTWRRPTDWVTTRVNAQEGFWVRIRVTVVTVPPVNVPTQGAKPIYTVSWPWIEFDSDEISGDLPALAEMCLGAIAHRAYLDPRDHGTCRNIILGLWNIERGDSFTSYLECALNKAGITVGGTGIPTTLSTSPSGTVRRWAPAGAVSNVQIVTWNIATNPEHWLGEYRVFVRYIYNSGVAVSLQARASLNTSGYATIYSEEQYTQNATVSERYVLDLGTIRIGPENEKAITAVNIQIYGTTTAAASIDIMDIVLIPIDELSIEIDTNEAVSDMRRGGVIEKAIVINSLSPKFGTNTNIMDVSNFGPPIVANVYLSSQCITRILGNFQFKPNTQYRIFHFGWYQNGDEPFDTSDATFTDKLNTVSQYIFARGTE